MLVAFFIWLLAKLGMPISPERIDELEAEFYRRPTLVNVHFGRVFIPHAEDARIFGIGYVRYPGKQRYVGVGLTAELVMPRSISDVARSEFSLAAQVAVHPIKPLELSYAFGGYWKREDQLAPFNRWGVGYRVMALKLAPVPAVWIDLVGKHPRYLLGCQLEF